MPKEIDAAAASHILARQIEANTIASILMSQNSITNRAEGFLDRYFAVREVCDNEVWREVIYILSQAPTEQDSSRIAEFGTDQRSANQHS